MNEIETARAHWARLATEADDFATYEESLGRFGGAYRNRARSYRQTVAALTLEIETGVPHCSCCLKTAAARGKC